MSLEKSEVYATTAKGALDLAGLGKVVKVSSQKGRSFTARSVRHWQFHHEPEIAQGDAQYAPTAHVRYGLP